MIRKIFDVNIPYNFPFIFYQHDNKLTNICDVNSPEPIESYHSWSPDKYFAQGAAEKNRIIAPPVRMRKEHFSEYIKLNLPELQKYADKQNIMGNVFVIKKFDADYVAVAMIIYDAIGDVEVG